MAIIIEPFLVVCQSWPEGTPREKSPRCYALFSCSLEFMNSAWRYQNAGGRETPIEPYPRSNQLKPSYRARPDRNSTAFHRGQFPSPDRSTGSRSVSLISGGSSRSACKKEELVGFTAPCWAISWPGLVIVVCGRLLLTGVVLFHPMTSCWPQYPSMRFHSRSACSSSYSLKWCSFSRPSCSSSSRRKWSASSPP